ncbi:hypothetical protein ACFYPB_40320 [Streptomyces olivaceoviridis]|uniref:hypothetical protein n=1 Tax=Streptomyces olivaceoviridis TaxID=1921 RepID=UPI0036CE4337
MVTEATTPVKAGAEKKLYIFQQGIPEDAPGGVPTLLSFGILSPNEQPINPGDVTYTLNAPTGFKFTGWVTWAYHDLKTLAAKGNMQTVEGKVTNDGRTLTFTHNPHLFTNSGDQGALGFAACITAVDDAAPGRYTDGELRVGSAAPVQLKARVLENEDD